MLSIYGPMKSRCVIGGNKINTESIPLNLCDVPLQQVAGSWWLTCVSGATLAAVVVGKLDAAVRASWVTGVGETFIHVSLTAFPNIPCGTDALIPSDLIHTLPLVKALWLFGERVEERVAVIDVDFTVHT